VTSARWEQIKQLFNDALALSENERELFLTNAACGDTELLREVKSLLVSASHSSDDERVTTNFFTIESGGTDSLIGTRIGAFTVVREVARGGMGVVLEGVREDEFTQRVAIKIIRGGFGSEEIVRRFRAERAVLSSLNHPHIAQFIDGGNLPDARLPDGQGTPFLIMEFIEGTPIDEYCDANGLDIRSRLELFLSVCSAVHYAHQNLVVHRDLKPSNIFVTAHGIKLLDFGIAKLLSGEPTEATLAATQAHFLTPEYASPEQILNRNVTTASDTYSLGVLLYKLLTGQRPYRFLRGVPLGKSPALRDVEQAIIEEQPTKPSSCALKGEARAAETRAASKAKLSKILAGDLDTIVLKALQKEPERRYSSVEQFQRDIQRYLSGLPVSAQPDSLAYRFSKYVRRNKLAVGAAVLIFLSLAGGIVASLVQAQRAERERDRAQAEAEKAKQVVSVLKEMFASADRSRSTKRDITVAEVLEHASARIEKDFANQPEIAADVLSTIGSTYEGLAMYDRALTTLQVALRLQELSHGKEHPDVAEVLHALATNHYLKQERAAAESLFHRSLTMFRSFGTLSGAFATTLNDYASFLQDQGQYTLADSLFRAAIRIYETLPTDNRKGLATSLHNLALNYDWLGNISAADSLYRRSLNLQREAYGGVNAQMAITIGNMGFLAEARGDYIEAGRLYRESLAIREVLLDESHDLVTANKIKLGLFQLDHSTEFEEAERLCREALAVVRKANPSPKRLVARAHLGIGRALEQLGKIRDAEAELQSAVENFALVQPPNAKNLAEAEVFLAQNFTKQGRFRESEVLLLRARGRLRAASADSSAEMKRVNESLEHLFATWKKK
jgi:serine/threonine-protein kinase